MKMKWYFKISIVAIFPFFRAFLIGNTIPDISMMFVHNHNSLLYAVLDFQLWPLYKDKGMGFVNDMANSIFLWGFFYLSMASIFRREERLVRFYEFAKYVIPTAFFGALLLVCSFPEGLARFKFV